MVFVLPGMQGALMASDMRVVIGRWYLTNAELLSRWLDNMLRLEQGKWKDSQIAIITSSTLQSPGAAVGIGPSIST